MSVPPDILTRPEIDEAVRGIFRRSQVDPAFRQRCLEDPAAAIHEMTGKVLPPGLVIEFREADAGGHDGAKD